MPDDDTITIIDQLNGAALSVEELLQIRSAIDKRLRSIRDELEHQLETVRAAFRNNGRAPAQGAGSSSRASRRSARGAAATGKHTGLSVAEAVRIVIQNRGGNATVREIKEAFATAGDERQINFTVLLKSGGIRRIGTAISIGKKGRAGGIYGLS